MPKSHLTSQAEDFPRWYQDVVAKAKLAENGPVRGTMVIKPYGYSIWENMQAQVDQRIKAAGAQNAYFPLFIPEEYIQKESTHLEGFSPELAVVTHGGGKELAEPVIVRPTSETIINSLFSKWINSHRDLPLKINQWANVVRWEMRPRIFLRTTEFLWQEGHTAHATQQQAWDFAVEILKDVYRDFMEKILLIPIYTGLKTKAEQFPGAIQSLSCEAMMGDGKALQMGTSHALGQSFSKMFDIRFLDKEGEHFVWQTSWGVSTRMMGGLIMAHGDDWGLNLPPALAPVQAVVMVVREDPAVESAADEILKDLLSVGIRAVKDRCEDSSFGRNSVDWEIKGIPLRIEIGPRDLEEGKCVLVKRDLREKSSFGIADIAGQVQKELESISQRLWEKAASHRKEKTASVKSPEEAIEAAGEGFAVMDWDKLGESGEAVLAKSGISVRCLMRRDESLPLNLDEPELIAVLARAY